MAASCPHEGDRLRRSANVQTQKRASARVRARVAARGGEIQGSEVNLKRAKKRRCLRRLGEFFGRLEKWGSQHSDPKKGTVKVHGTKSDVTGTKKPAPRAGDERHGSRVLRRARRQEQGRDHVPDPRGQEAQDAGTTHSGVRGDAGRAQEAISLRGSAPKLAPGRSSRSLYAPHGSSRSR